MIGAASGRSSSRTICLRRSPPTSMMSPAGSNSLTNTMIGSPAPKMESGIEPSSRTAREELRITAPLAGGIYLIDPDVASSRRIPLVATGGGRLIWRSDSLRCATRRGRDGGDGRRRGAPNHGHGRRDRTQRGSADLGAIALTAASGKRVIAGLQAARRTKNLTQDDGVAQSLRGGKARSDSRRGGGGDLRGGYGLGDPAFAGIVDFEGGCRAARCLQKRGAGTGGGLWGPVEAQGLWFRTGNDKRRRRVARARDRKWIDRRNRRLRARFPGCDRTWLLSRRRSC